MARLIQRLFIPIIAIILSSFYLAEVLGKTAKAAYLIQPVFYLICITFVIITIMEITSWKKEQALEKNSEANKKQVKTNKEFKTMMISIAATGIYILLIKYIGFAISTCVFLFSGFNFMKNKKKWLSAVLAIVITLALWLIFNRLLFVPLPKGLLGF